MKLNLYPWQKDCLEQWFRRGGRGIVQAVTGAGKTVLALTAAQQLNRKLRQNLRVKIVVPTKALQRQWEQALKTFFFVSPGEISLMGGGHSAVSGRPYTICLIQSARYQLARQILGELREGRNVLMLADECHHYASGQNRLIFEFLSRISERNAGASQGRFYSLGLTATLPEGEDREYLCSVLGPELYTYSLRQAAGERRICEYDLFHISLHFTPEEQEEYRQLSDQMASLYRRLSRKLPGLSSSGQRDRFSLLRHAAAGRRDELSRAALLYLQLSYKRKNLVCLASDRIQAACALIERLPPGRQLLVFGERIRQAEELYKILKQMYPQQIACFHSQNGALANRNALERFRRREVRILIACKSLDEGLDLPDLSAALILSGTSSQRQRIQRLGRILRNTAGKEAASLYYFHVEESNEEREFLPDGVTRRIFDLEYDGRTLRHPAYDRAAAALLAQVRQRQIPRAFLTETERCLNTGSVLGDWMLSAEELEQRLEEAADRRQRNYWFCMRRLGQSTGGTETPSFSHPPAQHPEPDKKHPSSKGIQQHPDF